jgi:hypothetical protein
MADFLRASSSFRFFSSSSLEEKSPVFLSLTGAISVGNAGIGFPPLVGNAGATGNVGVGAGGGSGGFGLLIGRASSGLGVATTSTRPKSSGIVIGVDVL